MAKVETSDPVSGISGKISSNNSGYFYIRNGKQFYRSREETYQANQSPRQKWNSAAFAYAHKELHTIESDSKPPAWLTPSPRKATRPDERHYLSLMKVKTAFLNLKARCCKQNMTIFTELKY